MIALIGKIIAIGLLGQNIIPVVFIIPAIALTSITLTVLVLNGLQQPIENSPNPEGL